MNVRQIIEDRTLITEIESKLHEIANVLDRNENRIHDMGVGFGSMGLILFWTYYYMHFEDEKVSKKISFLLGKHYNALKYQASISDFVYLRAATSLLSRREQELSECGWAYELLASLEIVEPRDIRQNMATTDRGLYRKMIDIIMDPSWTYLPDALMIGSYCVTKPERIAKEFLRRFVSELYSRVNQAPFKDRIHAVESQSLVGLLVLLSKIEQKNQDILLIPECKSKLYTNWIESNASLFDNPESQLQEQDVWLLYAMTLNDRYRSEAIRTLKQAEQRIRLLIETMPLEAGMERGLVCFGHLFNRLHRQTQDFFFEAISCLCYQRFSRMATTMGNSGWNTLSRGMFHVNLGLKNGIAGTGLALLACVSNINPQWDEYFHLS